MADIFFNSFMKNAYDGSDIDLVNDTIKVALLDDGYTPDRDAHDFFDDVSADEVSGAGYTTGGVALASKTWTQDNPNDLAKYDADDVSWANSTITARYGVIYKDTGDASTSPLIMLLDFGSNQSTNNTEFKITWNASGIFQLSQG